MKIAIISFTERGRLLSERIQGLLQGEEEILLYGKPEEGVIRWAGEQFAERNALVFIGACGIAVRAIAPFVKDKLQDSPVLVLDEEGKYVVPILSGHVGGANELAEALAKRLGAVPVITTATDVNRKFAVDLFAKRNGLTLWNKEGIAPVSAKILRGEKASVSIEGMEAYHGNSELTGMWIPEELELVPYPPKQKTDIVISADIEVMGQAVLFLKPKEYVLGIGCKKGKSEEEIHSLIQKKVTEMGIEIRDIAMIASIDRKKEEAGICGWASHNRIPYLTFSAEQLQAVEGAFCHSGFVKQTVGVDNVCERAALAACGKGGSLLAGKQAENGITLAVAKRRRKIDWKG